LKQLKDFETNLGKMENGASLIRDRPVFGHRKLAEGLIEWSARNPPKSTFDRCTNWGLVLRAVADGDNPSMLLYLDRRTLHRFMEGFGPLAVFHLSDYGVDIAGPTNTDRGAIFGREATLCIYISQEENIERLYEYIPAGCVEEEPEELELLGGILTGASGFNLLNAEEVLAGVAAIRTKAAAGNGPEEAEVIVEEPHKAVTREAVDEAYFQEMEEFGVLVADA